MSIEIESRYAEHLSQLHRQSAIVQRICVTQRFVGQIKSLLVVVGEIRYSGQNYCRLQQKVGNVETAGALNGLFQRLDRADEIRFFAEHYASFVKKLRAAVEMRGGFRILDVCVDQCLGFVQP